MLKDAMAFYSAIEGKVRDTVLAMSGKNLQCERYDVTTAPNGATGKIGVTQPFGNEIFVPYSAACAGAAVGDTVLVVWWKSLSNAKAWFMGDAIGEGGGAVTSVNGQTGAVELDAADVGALPDDTTIPQIDDGVVSPSALWSSQKIDSMFASGTSNGWTYYRIGTICFAWYYKQLTGVDITASWSGLYYRSGEIEAAPYPTFLANGYKFSAALAGGSQNGGVTLGRIMNSNSALRVYLMATGSVTSANCAVMVFAMGTWNG